MIRPVFVAILSISIFAVKASAAEPQWYRGNTHTHSLWSDGNDFPEMIAAFYKESGYHFLVLSDHNVLSRGEKWMKVKAIEKKKRALGPSVLKKNIAKYGEDWVELRGEGAAAEVRLKTLEEIRPLFDEPEKFLLIEGEEITDRFEKRQVHIGAVNLGEVVAPQKGDSLRATMRNNLIAVQEQAERLQRPILAHLNHPNFQWSITAEDIAHVLEEQFMEVYNGHPGINHLGDATRPSDEKIWDIANTIRLASLDAEPLYGVASDDSHTYHGGDVKPGRGWVMVQAEELDAGKIVEAMQAGDFYASTGISFESLSVDAGALKFEIAAEPGETYTTQIFGTRKGNEGDPAMVGEVLATILGNEVEFTLTDDLWYFRATITSDKAHPLPSFEGQQKQAWTQPVWSAE